MANHMAKAVPPCLQVGGGRERVADAVEAGVVILKHLQAATGDMKQGMEHSSSKGQQQTSPCQTKVRLQHVPRACVGGGGRGPICERAPAAASASAPSQRAAAACAPARAPVLPLPPSHAVRRRRCPGRGAWPRPHCRPRQQLRRQQPLPRKQRPPRFRRQRRQQHQRDRARATASAASGSGTENAPAPARPAQPSVKSRP